MTTMNGKIVIAGNSIEELERELATVKALVAMGKTCGVGGKSIAEVEDGLKMVGGTPPHCCNCHCCEDEDEDLYDEEDEYEDEDEYYEEEDEVDIDIDEITDELRDVGYALKDVLEKLGAI